MSCSGSIDAQRAAEPPTRFPTPRPAGTASTLRGPPSWNTPTSSPRHFGRRLRRPPETTSLELDAPGRDDAITFAHENLEDWMRGRSGFPRTKEGRLDHDRDPPEGGVVSVIGPWNFQSCSRSTRGGSTFAAGNRVMMQISDMTHTGTVFARCSRVADGRRRGRGRQRRPGRSRGVQRAPGPTTSSSPDRRLRSVASSAPLRRNLVRQ
ncbi:hypothetical protein HBB16_11820 [Pseudonocardia sp. MCCB 268]|nr:hypothetical protein [Pseudonocardia cytotoxica]